VDGVGGNQKGAKPEEGGEEGKEFCTSEKECKCLKGRKTDEKRGGAVGSKRPREERREHLALGRGSKREKGNPGGIHSINNKRKDRRGIAKWLPQQVGSRAITCVKSSVIEKEENMGTPTKKEAWSPSSHGRHPQSIPQTHISNK